MQSRLRTPVALVAVLATAALVVPLGAFAAPSSPARATVQAPSAAPAATPSDRLIVSVSRGRGAQAVAKARAAGGEVVKGEQPGGFVVVRAKSVGERDALARKLQADPAVAGVAVDRVVHATGVPNDPYYGEQWGLAKIGCPSAWNLSTGAGVTIAILDTGVTLTNPDLSPRLVSGYNVLSPGSSPSDDKGHGTAVAGVAAATMNNSIDGAGVAPSARIMPIKVLDATGSGYDSDVITGIRWAADHGAKVISMSLGSPDAPASATSTQYQSAVDYARGKGAVVVAASGNSGIAEAHFYPAAFNGVIAVGATNSNDVRSSFSSYGSYVDVVAPGEGIITLNRDGSMGSWSGTSLATPFVSGLAALVAARNPSMTAAIIEQQIEGTAKDLGAPGRDDYYGRGRVDAYAALTHGGPKITTAKFTNPVAYDLKSLQATRFYTAVDSANSWVELRIKTPKGDKVFTGGTGAANTNFYFPLWDGKAPDGTRLASASYDWTLSATKAGLTTTTRGKVTVSRICFSSTGIAKAGSPVQFAGYMIPGSANVYVSAHTSTPADVLSGRLTGPGYSAGLGSVTMNSTSSVASTWYVRGAAELKSRAIHTFTMTGQKAVTYAVTVIQ